jgi:sulfite exporter TauE/SafE
MVGYSTLGAVAAVSMQGLGWLTVQSAALRPVWTLFHVATFVLGSLLLWRAKQPVWLDKFGRSIWLRARSLAAGRGRSAPFVVGALWTFLPCGLLYSALLVATLSGRAVEGAMVMALFVFGTSASMTVGPWLLLRFGGQATGGWGVRLAGLALAASSLWTLWMGFIHNAAPWCTAA